ncbi:MAG: hypothetical protein ABFS86_13910, partial [Planctomycetota bacterium]
MARTAILILFLALGSSAVAGSDGIDVTRDPDSGDVTIRVDAPGGIAAWESVARGLARARGYDDGALAGVLPEGGVRVDGLGGYLTLTGLNALLTPAVRIGYLSAATTGGEPVLTIRLRRRALLATKRRFEAMLKSLASPRPGSGKFGLTLDEGWEKAPKDRRLVVLIHGL